MVPTKQAETIRIRLTYNEKTGKVTRKPAREFKVGELLEFYSSGGKRVKVILHPESAYLPNIYDETSLDKQPVKVVKAKPGKVWCYFAEPGSLPGYEGNPTWSEKYGFESDPHPAGP